MRGIELGFVGNVTLAWSIFGNYSYMPSKITDADATVTNPAVTVDKPFPNTAKNSFILFTTYKLGHKVTLGGGTM